MAQRFLSESSLVIFHQLPALSPVVLPRRTFLRALLLVVTYAVALTEISAPNLAQRDR
jgi:hypothetical protein